MPNMFDVCGNLRDGLAYLTPPFVAGLHDPVQCRKCEKSLAARVRRRSRSRTAAVAGGSHNWAVILHDLANIG